MKRVWEWLKKYWKWLLFPIGIIGALIAFVAGRNSKPVPVPDPGPDTNDAALIALHEAENANKRRDELLRKLEAENQARLQQLTADQQKEFEKLKDAPIDEVVSWFDGLR